LALALVSVLVCIMFFDFFIVFVLFGGDFRICNKVR
jgi:hypothetical protein